MVCACSPDPEPPPPPPPPTPPPQDCRPVFECALYCDGDECADPCYADAKSPADADGARAIMQCLDTNCAASTDLPACLVEHCFEPLNTCYYKAADGDAACGATWSCFGDCGDDPACLDACLAATSHAAQRLFSAVEVCSDRYVINQCTAPGDACDIEALHTVCKTKLDACLTHEAPAPTEQTIAVCDALKPCAHDDCAGVVQNLLAGCPSTDREAFLAREACLAGKTCAEMGSCPAFEPSSLCLEVLPPPGQKDYP